MATYTFNRSSLQLDRSTIKVLNTGEDSFKHDLQQLYEGVQADRAEMLAQVRELQLAAQLVLGAESARIAARAPLDPRAEALAQSAAVALARSEALEQEIDIASIRVPMIKKTEALVHGRITDAVDRTAGPVTVTLADEQGREVPGVAPVEVDSAGYYALVVPPEAAATLGEDAKLKVIVSSGAERVAPTTAPIILKPGAVLVHDVKLNDGELGTLKLRTVFDAGPAVRPAKKSAPSPTKRAATSKSARAKTKRRRGK
jgi:hypothetical protein